jgi:hypothetical protein
MDRGSGRDETGLVGEDHGLNAAVQAELEQDAGDGLLTVASSMNSRRTIWPLDRPWATSSSTSRLRWLITVIVPAPAGLA